MGFKENLKKYRKAAGYSQTEFAELIGVGKTTVLNWEKGNNKPQNKKIYETINDVLGVDIEKGIKKEDNSEPAELSSVMNFLQSYIQDPSNSIDDKAYIVTEIQKFFINYVVTSYPAG